MANPDGNSVEYALLRLRKDRPDLHAKVKAGELTAHSAMRKAGFRLKTFSVPLDPDRAAKILAKQFGDRLPDLITMLSRNRA